RTRPVGGFVVRRLRIRPHDPTALHPTRGDWHTGDGQVMIEDRRQSHTARHCAPRPAARLPGVTIQFHPDWPFRNGTVLEAIAADGRYRSQFETGTSNGGLTAHHGGDRWQWEIGRASC